MSDSWANTKASINRLKNGWQESDEDTRWDIGFWTLGLAMMAVAIVAQFGWIGFLFCVGFVIWGVGNSALRQK